MKATVILLAILLGCGCSMRLASNTVCACSELLQADCALAALICTWANSTCSSKGLDCTTFNATACPFGHGCALNSNNTCAPFTKCGDYSYTDTSQCYNLDQSCSAGTPCVAQTVTGCSSINDETTCEMYGCLYNNKACGTKYCANITKAEKCTNVGSNDFNNIGICAWNTTTSACGDSTVTTLSSSNCLQLTWGTYRWDGAACTACKGSSSSSSTILAFIGFAATLLY